jgi:hypothetical protein
MEARLTQANSSMDVLMMMISQQSQELKQNLLRDEARREEQRQRDAEDRQREEARGEESRKVESEKRRLFMSAALKMLDSFGKYRKGNRTVSCDGE